MMLCGSYFSSLFTTLPVSVWVFIIHMVLTFSRKLNYRVLHHFGLGSFPALDKVGKKEKGEERQQKPLKMRWKSSTPFVSGTAAD